MDRRFIFISAGIAAAHIGWLSLGNTFDDPIKPLPKKLIVQTVTLQKETVVSPSKEEVVKVSEVKETIASPSKEEVAKVSAVKEKKVEKASKPVVKKKAEPVVAKEEKKVNKEDQARKEKLLAAARDNLNKAVKQKKGEKLNDLSPLKIESPEGISSEEAGYYGLLTEALQKHLLLPESGNVKIQLVLDKGGKVVSIKTLISHSKLNSQYVEKLVPDIQFPAFSNFLKNENTHTFTITLTHDA